MDVSKHAGLTLLCGRSKGISLVTMISKSGLDQALVPMCGHGLKELCEPVSVDTKSGFQYRDNSTKPVGNG